jgi:NADH-quinone oxidoreductase subunit L
VKRHELPERIRAQNEPLYKVVFNKYWVDEAYDKVVVRPLRATANALYRVVDRVLVDTLMVEGFGAVGRAGGLLVRQLQNGDVQRYAFFILFGLSLILYLVFVG